MRMGRKGYAFHQVPAEYRGDVVTLVSGGPAARRLDLTCPPARMVQLVGWAVVAAMCVADTEDEELAALEVRRGVTP